MQKSSDAFPIDANGPDTKYRGWVSLTQIDRHLHARQSIAELTAVLAALIGIGRIPRPEPMIWALVFVQDRPRPVGHELHSPRHSGELYRGMKKRSSWPGKTRLSPNYACQYPRSTRGRKRHSVSAVTVMVKVSESVSTLSDTVIVTPGYTPAVLAPGARLNVAVRSP
jgi:hypothetical protein